MPWYIRQTNLNTTKRKKNKMLIAAKKAKLAELNASTDKEASDNDDSAGNGGFVAGMITKIVNNLKLIAISDVHFRLEDKSSDERHPFAVGAVLKESDWTRLTRYGRVSTLETI